MSKITVQTLGTLTVTGPCGETLTPRGAKVCGLLALLAVAKGRWCARAWLQDKLWSDRGQRQGQDSLRHAVADLRSALGSHAQALCAEGRNLALDRERALVDLYDPLPRGVEPLPGDQCFLAGIDIRDREFEAWLRDRRAGLAERPARAAGPANVSRSGFHIALLPVESVAHDELSSLFSASIAGRVATSLANLGPFVVLDYSDDMPGRRGGGEVPDAFLSLRSVRFGESLNLSFALRRVTDSEIIWSATRTVELGPRADVAVSALVIQVTDQIARVLHRPGVLGPAERHQAARFALAGIDRMFSLAPDSLAESDIAFGRATEIDPKGTYFAWHAYLTVFLSYPSAARVTVAGT